MVSYYSSTEGNGSASTMDESQKIFCTQPKSTPSRQTPSSSPSQSQFQSLSDSCEHISTLPRNKTRTAKTPTTPSKPATSSAKRPRNEDDEPTNKKPKPTKEEEEEEEEEAEAEEEEEEAEEEEEEEAEEEEEDGEMTEKESDEDEEEYEEVQTDVEVMNALATGKTSNSIGFSSEEMFRKISSARTLPALDVSKARMLEQKWQRQHLLELEVCCGRLALLQEECQIRMKKLLSFMDAGRH